MFRKWLDVKPELWKRILKCSIAYEISFILVLIPKVAANIGVVPYLLILGALFFNASTTVGNQVVQILLNILTAVPAMIWCGLVAYFCSLYNKALARGVPLYSDGAGIIAGIGFFICVLVSAYYRLRYPRLFIPMLEAFTIPFFGLTRNIYSTTFDVEYIIAIFYPVLIGGGIALLVNIVLWPETAAKAASVSMSDAVDAVRDILLFVNQSVLVDELAAANDANTSVRIRALNDGLNQSINRMRQAQEEAKYELVISYYAPQWYRPLVNSIDDLSKNLYGFSRTIEREINIIRSMRWQDHHLHQERGDYQHSRASASGYDDGPPMEVLQRQPSGDASACFKRLNRPTSTVTHYSFRRGAGYRNLVRLQANMQGDIQRFLEVCVASLDHAGAFLAENHAIPPHKTPRPYTAEVDVHAALEKLREQELVLEREYDEGHVLPDDDHFLIYTILFTLCEIGRDILQIEKNVKYLVSKRSSFRFPKMFFPKVPLSAWLSKATHQRWQETDLVNAQRQEKCTEPTDVFPTRRSFAYASHDASALTSHENIGGIGERTQAIGEAEDEEEEEEEDREVREEDMEDDGTGEALQHAKGKHWWNQWARRCTQFMRRGPTRYAIKFAITTEILAVMAWIPSVTAFYNDNHGQWALLSAMVVFNYTIGSTALQCFFRVVATIIGAVCGYIALLAGFRNQYPYVLAIFFFIFQVPFWYLLLATKYHRIGFISLLTMAVIMSTGYYDTLDEGIFAPVWKRTVTAIIAIIVVMIVNQILWPVWARERTRKYLAELLIATGIQYSKVASLVSQSNPASPWYLSTLKDCKKNSKKLTMQLNMVKQMLIMAQDEPRITKGPFPYDVYRDIIHHEQNLLFWIEYLRKVQALIPPLTRIKIMVPMNAYRRELAAAVHLFLFTLACSLSTKSALPASLASAELPRQMLRRRQDELWEENYKDLCQLASPGEAKRKSAENQVYWHTYADGSIEVIDEQEAMGALVARLMGQLTFKGATMDWTT